MVQSVTCHAKRRPPSPGGLRERRNTKQHRTKPNPTSTDTTPLLGKVNSYFVTPTGMSGWRSVPTMIMIAATRPSIAVC